MKHEKFVRCAVYIGASVRTYAQVEVELPVGVSAAEAQRLIALEAEAQYPHATFDDTSDDLFDLSIAGVADVAGASPDEEAWAYELIDQLNGEAICKGGN